MSVVVTNPTITFYGGGKTTAFYGGAGITPGPSSLTQLTQGVIGSTNGLTEIAYKTNTLAFGASDTIDLTSITDLNGNTIAFTGLLFVDVQIVSSAGGFIRVGNAAAYANALWFGGTTPTADIYPGGPAFMQGNPDVSAKIVVDGTHKNVKIANPHGSLAVQYVARFGGTV